MCGYDFPASNAASPEIKVHRLQTRNFCTFKVGASRQEISFVFF